LPSDIVEWVRPLLYPDTVFLWMFLLTAWALYRWFRVKRCVEDPLGTALIVVCATGFLAMHKQILRPHIMTQMRIFPFVAACIFLLIVWRERKPAPRIAIALLAGCFCAAVSGLGLSREIMGRVRSAPERVFGSTVALFSNWKEYKKVNASLYARSHFAEFKTENAVADTLLQECGLRAEDDIYVLGDAPVFYILLNKLPPYSINTYNDSPVYEQQTVVDWLRKKAPRFVIWETDVSGYDFVPYTVRLPLIHSYVVEHYEFARAVGAYHILQQRPPEHVVNLGYWRRMLGPGLDLGHVPWRARLSEYESCGNQPANCDPVIVVRYPQPRQAPREKLKVTIETSDHDPFRIELDVAPGEREYVINLNRVWFWEFVSGSGPRVTVEGDAAKAVLEYRRERRPVLY
jgi:hypothetical protein